MASDSIPNEPSTPQLGTHSANPGYAVDQILRALEHLKKQDAAAPASSARVSAWWSVLSGMMGGTLRIGSRTPVTDTPPWATPQVVTGGFTTGRLMAGGMLREHERTRLARLDRDDLLAPAAAAVLASEAARAALVTAQTEGVTGWRDLQPFLRDAATTSAAAEVAVGPARAALNALLLESAGFPELVSRLADGCYRAQAPEELALLCVAWLTMHGHVEEARLILEEVGPWFPRLRFFPEPAMAPRREGVYCLQTLGEVRARLERMRVPENVRKQREILTVCAPLHDRLVALWLETVSGERPALDPARPGISGGWPCQQYPEGWATRAQSLADEVVAAACERLGSRWRSGRRGTFAWMVEPLASAIRDPASLSGRQVGRLRLVLAQIAQARGLPGSARSEAVRSAQRRALAKPELPRVAALLSRRTAADPWDEGLTRQRLDQLCVPITTAEDVGLAGFAIPSALTRKLEKAREGSLADLVDTGIATSAEGLVRVLPRVVAQARAAGWSDPGLRRLATEAYLAFARRRSLLLLNLESQVRRLEIPWVRAIERYRDRAGDARGAARSQLQEIVTVMLRGFPATILPNRFIREARTLIQDAGLDLPLTEELATDIFMGAFSGQFLMAAHQAAAALEGTLYARYYGIPYDRVLRMRPVPSSGRSTSPDLMALCIELAGATGSRAGSPAANGTIIEQQQIITSHNLATLFAGLGLDATLASDLPAMSQACFTGILELLGHMPKGWVQRLRVVKRAAYAWRQMVFFLSRQPLGEQERFLTWAHGELATRPAAVRDGLVPALRGLAAALVGGTPPRPLEVGPNHCVRFLGWTTGRHWLLVRMDLAVPPPSPS